MKTPTYYVYRLGGGPPIFRHDCLESAHAEAKRLAQQHPGHAFEILQCCATVRTIEPTATVWHTPPPIQF